MALSIGGERITGQTVRTQNVMAATAIANIVKTSLGPVGLDKMMVDEVGVCFFIFSCHVYVIFYRM